MAANSDGAFPPLPRIGLGLRPQRQNMTSKDTRFMKEIGIEPCDLDKPFQPSLPLPERESLISPLTESDVAFLLKYGVFWGPDPDSGFVPPHNLREYLSRFPNGIRNGVEN